MSLISSEINLILTSAKCVFTNSANAKLYVLVVTWPTQDNAKLLQQLKSSFKRTVNEEKNQSKKNKNDNSTFTSLNWSRLNRINRRFVLSFENKTDRTVNAVYYLLNVAIKDYNMIDGQNLFDQPVKSNIKTFDNIKKIAIGLEDDYTTACMIDYPYFKDHYMIAAIDVTKKQAFNADPKTTQQIHFAWNMAQGENANTKMFYLLKKQKKKGTILVFSQRTVVRVL